MTWGLRTTLALGLLVFAAGDLAAIDAVLLPRYLSTRSARASGRPAPATVRAATVTLTQAPSRSDTAPSAEVGDGVSNAPALPPAGAAEAPRAKPSKADPVAAERVPDLPDTWPCLLFEMNAARLTDRSREILDSLAEHLVQHPGLEVLFEGHTDDLGGPEVNHPLSRMRAATARNWLVSRGVDAPRIQIHNFGSSKPVAPGRTAEARAQNRRVEITVRERID